MYDVKGERRALPRTMQREVLDGVRSVTTHDVAVAVTQRAIVPFYQPVIDVRSGDIVGFQALARWVRPSTSPLPAASFIGVIESSGVGFSLDLAMLRHAAADLASRRTNEKLYVHVSPRFLTRLGVARFVREVLTHARMAAKRLTLVVPAALIVERASLVGDALSGLRDLDVRLAADLPPTDRIDVPRANHLLDELRLGRAWVTGLAADPRPLAAAIAVAHERGLRARVAGVETDQQFNEVASFGADLAEGRWLAGPHPQPLPTDAA
jgi:EAL domain-containing protein (putative c-di-GMP-specific phosphodiesterase class I)